MQRIIVAGAGAVGSYLAGRLSSGGIETLLLARGKRVREIANNKIDIEFAGQVMSATVPVATTGDGAGIADVVFLCTKAPDVEGSLCSLTTNVGPSTAIVTLQNGVEAPQLIAAKFPCSPAFVAEFPADATTSMHRDLEARRPSEYVSLTGAVIRMAAVSRISVPAHKEIESLIRQRGLLT
ncbi:hypothetical protein H7F50_17180 [Novosphingobium flavum]|uniref:ketopantoate reductase family protein n=1 Tax=Novosphingobium aerophilum TaxID=2839843 RepID=UPI00163B5A2C|nr:2-dehydropantoate 2-reductase N-terminal domain-containing protein [Novosphingobium aerophilum]MBC2663478.1 hypothetical protein [Novosphingobium aerophilum]